MINFIINGDEWVLHYVEPFSPYLIDRTGRYTIGCTDPLTKTVYISKYLNENLITKVIIHELCHCVMVSYGYTDYIQEVVYPWQVINVEELICNYIENNLDRINYLSDYILRKSGLR